MSGRLYGTDMDSFTNLIDKLGGPVAVAKAIRQGDAAVGKWKIRNSINARHWPDLVKLAAEKRVKGVTMEKLCDLAKRKAS